MVAPFWADHDTRPEGKISYEVHNANTGLISTVSNFVRQTQQNNFNGTWMLVAEWSDVLPFGSTSEVHWVFVNEVTIISTWSMLYSYSYVKVPF